MLDSISNHPHKAAVTVALSNPHREHMFATASLDGSFKIWDRLAVQRTSATAPEQHCWQCIATGSWRRQPILTGCFGADGSTLITGVAGFVVIWETESGSELQPVALKGMGDRPEQLCSVVACERLLMLAVVRSSGQKEEILCWDLASLEVVARLDLASCTLGSTSQARCCMRCALPASTAGALLVSAFRQDEGELLAWRLAPDKASDDKDALAFVEETSATLPGRHGLRDAAFVSNDSTDEGCHLLCWTSSSELWDLDLSVSAGADKRRPAEIEADEEPSRQEGPLAGILSGRASQPASDPAGPRLLKLPIRTTANQQAGLVPRLVQKIIPPHVPSHALPPPPVLWQNFVSVYVKLDEGVQPALPVLSESGAGADAKQDAFEAPPWMELAGERPPGEFVDADWMDQLVKGAFGEE